jgi:hypothetical protein
MCSMSDEAKFEKSSTSCRNHLRPHTSLGCRMTDVGCRISGAARGDTRPAQPAPAAAKSNAGAVSWPRTGYPISPPPSASHRRVPDRKGAKQSWPPTSRTTRSPATSPPLAVRLPLPPAIHWAHADRTCHVRRHKRRNGGGAPPASVPRQLRPPAHPAEQVPI